MAKTLLKSTIIIFMVTFFNQACCYANKEGFDLGKQLAKGRMSGAFDEVAKFDKDTVPVYEKDEKQELPYDEGFLEQAPHHESQDSGVRDFVTTSYSNRPQYTVDVENDPLLRKSEKITQDPIQELNKFYGGSITKGKAVGGKYLETCEREGESVLLSCKYSLDVKADTTSSICEESAPEKIIECTKTLNIEVEKREPEKEMFTIEAHIAGNSGDSIINLSTHEIVTSASNQIQSIKGKTPSYSVKRANLKTLQITVLAQGAWHISGSGGAFDRRKHNARPVGVSFHSADNGQLLVKFTNLQRFRDSWDPGFWHRTQYCEIGNYVKFTVSYEAERAPKTKNHWNSTCAWFEKNNKCCKHMKSECIQGRETKIINGASVTRNCWQYKHHYSCYKDSKNDCEGLRKKGCYQIDSECKEKIGNHCVIYNQTMKCLNQFSEDLLNDCDELEKQAAIGNCQLIEQKTGSEEVREIDGFAKKDVFEKINIYQCKFSGRNDCKLLENRNCVEKGSKCVKTVGNKCVLFEKQYECTKEIDGEETVLAGKGIPFGMNGECQEDYLPNNEMMDVVSQLSMISEMRADQEKDPEIFKGDPYQCSRAPWGWSDCCRLGGFGQNISLANCSSEEKKLADLREKDRCVYVGRYCALKYLVGLGCRSWHYTYCCFNTKLQKTCQEGGRHQLGFGFGSAENPSCRGLAIKEIEKIEFGNLDFSGVYSDIGQKYKAPEPGQLKTSMMQRVTSLQKAKEAMTLKPNKEAK